MSRYEGNGRGHQNGDGEPGGDSKRQALERLSALFNIMKGGERKGDPDVMAKFQATWKILKDLGMSEEEISNEIVK